jgi:hypothetical protein
MISLSDVVRSSSGSLMTNLPLCTCSACIPPVQPVGRFGAEMDALFTAYGEGGEGKFWLLFGDELEEQEARVLSEYIAAKPALELAQDAAIASYQARNKAERVAIRVGACCTKRTEARAQKKCEPCKFLYSCVGTPARSTTMHVSSECWSHEYTDAVTGKKVVKHVCDRLHPGEDGWLAEWATDRHFKPVVVPQNGWFAERGRLVAQAAPRQQRQPLNRQQAQRQLLTPQQQKRLAELAGRGRGLAPGAEVAW